MGLQISTGREDRAGIGTVLPTLREGLEFELSDSEAENSMLSGDYLWQGVELVIADIPSVLEVHFMCSFLTFGRILLQGSGSTNLYDPMRHPVDIWKVDVGV